MNAITKRILALVLCVVMLIGVMPVGALATETETPVEPSADTITVVEEEVTTEEDETDDISPINEEEENLPVVDDEEIVEEELNEEGIVEEEINEEIVVEEESVIEEEIPSDTEEEEPSADDETANDEEATVEEIVVAEVVEEEVTDAAAAVEPRATGNVIDAAIFCSDVHGSSSDLTSVMGGVKTSGVSYSAIGFVGDTCLTVDNTKSAVNSGLGYTPTVMFSYAASHDTEDGADIDTNWNYSGEVKGVSDYYLVYTIRETDMQNNTTAETDFTTWYSGLSATQKQLPIFIMSHRPLHARRNDNANAADWYEVISAAAESSDITFFWAHNHTGETSTDTNAYYVAKDGTETFTVYNGDTVVPNFTYMNAGYINANGQNPARINVATTVQITADSLVFQDYTSSGAYSGSYAHNVTVAREFASADSGETETVTLSSIAVTTMPTTTVYNVGDAFSSEGMVVTATYSDGSTAVVTEAVDLSEVDMTTAGTKTVTVTYGEGNVVEETSFDITVNAVVADDAVLTGIEITAQPTTLTYEQGSQLNLAGMVVTATFEDGTTAAVSDYEVTGYDANTLGEQTITVSYTYGEGDTAVTKTATFTVTVTEPSEDPSNEVTLGGGTTTTYNYTATATADGATGYILVSNGYALQNNNGTMDAVAVTVSNDESTITFDSAVDVSSLLWTIDSNGKMMNGNYYFLRTNGSGSYITYISTNCASDAKFYSWSYSGTTLTCTSSSATYYAYYNTSNNAFWTSKNTSQPLKFYVPTGGSTEVTYTMRAENLKKVVTDTSKTGTINFCLQGNGSDLTSLPSGGSYSFTVLSDAAGIISSIGTDGTVNFTGTTGTATVKVAYTWTQDGETHTVYKNITVEAAEPYYTLDITKGDTVVTGTTIIEKGVTSSTTLQLGTQITYTTDEGTTTLDSLPAGAEIEWHIPEEYQNIATINETSGLVTFKGVNGAFYVTTTLTVNGKDYTVGVNISAATSQYSVPTDGVTDFPEYPNEGAIRYDKTATAVGNFSETGIAQIELSMTGVPYTTGSEIDVVLMLDMTGSMTTDSMAAAEAAALAFARQIILNEDETYNNNRISVQIFNKNGVTELWAMSAVTADTYSSLVTAIESASTKQASGGTPYSTALAGCKNILDAARTDGVGNERQQFCVFVSDGTPTSYTDVDGGSDTSKKELYSSQMQADGVTVYGVYTSAAAGSSGSNGSGGSVNDTEEGTAIMQNVASSDDKVYVVEDYTDTSALTGVFTSIAQEIMQAATDITVEDQITDEYTMIFDIPTDTNYNHTISTTQEFYIEFLKYTLDENHERVDSDSDGDTYDDATSVTKLYLKNTNGVYSAASDASGTAYAAPVFAQSTIGDKGTLYYWTTDSGYASKAAVTYSDGTNTYYFIPYGMEANEDGTAPTGWYNMTSGAYAYGTVDSITNTSTNLVIATPYFVYNAATKMLYWTVDKLDTTEYALRYFLYLDNSATDVGETTEVAAATYPTNHHAYITYTNFNGNDCRQEFPIPQLTWNGAQVSYVFYLVNSAGQPINKSGQVVDFANATFITDIYTKAVVWNKGTDGQIEGDANLSVEWLASKLLPSDYLLYDVNAGYDLKVYADASGNSIFNYFTIVGDTADNISSSLNSRLSLSTTASTVSVETTKVYNTKAGTKYDDYGTYTSKEATNLTGETILSNFDFSNSTVAFAVVWQPRLVEDVVVVDYGLDVLINVVQNDILQNKVSGIGLGNSAYGDIAMNTGVSTASKLGTAALNIDGNTISIENENSVRFHQGDMVFRNPVKFYYETPVEFWEGSKATEGYMYSSVTVIPATTIYYEDDFLTLESYTVTKNEDGTSTSTKDATSQWTTDGTTVNATQDQDRPGASQISAALDADNNYGYDSAYESMSTHSLGSSAKITVDANTRGEATFTFWGTGFDVIGLTSNATGTLTVKVTDTAGNTVKSSIVDTYYGYTQNSEGNWVVTTGDNALYQVPVMKHFGMTYGQYTVKITAGYNEYFDHNTTDATYDLYLDAIRIYDPTGNENDVANGAYVQDGEGWPSYFEVRDKIIDPNAEQLGEEAADGIVFIDGIGVNPTVAQYTSYGPNNETYLTNNHAIAFELNAVATAGTEVAKVQLAVKSVGGNASVKVYSTDGITALDAEITTATDMYYDITALNGKTVVIVNDGENGILSLTNVKVTYTAAQKEATETTVEVFSIRKSSANAAIATLTVEEEVPETSEPSVPETSEPEETEPVKPSKSDLKDAVAEAKKLREKDYTKSSFKALKSAIKAAEKVLKNKKATDTQIEAALDALNAAVEALEAKPDSTALKKAVDAAKKLKEKNYTKDSFKTFKAALKAAQKVLKDGNATQADIDEALSELNEAMDTLVKKSSGAKPGKKR